MVLAFLTSIGAKHSAKMHQHPDWKWTNKDWFDHFAEEERLLFPLLLRLSGGRRLVQSLLVQHESFRQQMMAGRKINQAAMIHHATIEDGAVATLIDKGM